MEGVFKIVPLHVGTITRQVCNMAYMQEPGITREFPLIAWYLTDGIRNILVDTGGEPADGRRRMPYRQEPEQRLERALARLGIAPAEITHVISTHLHWDHVGGNGLFSHAVFFVQEAELAYARSPLPIHAGGYDMASVDSTAYRAVSGDCTVCSGITLLLTPGHTPGSQSVLADTARGQVVLTGDFIPLYECLERKPMVPNGIHTELVEYYHQMERIRNMGKPILPGHDFKVFELQQ